MNFTVLKTYRALIAAMLVVAFIVPVTVLLEPETAQAQGIAVPITDFVAPHAILTDLSTFYEKIKEGALDTVAWMVAKMAMQQLTASLITWINSGFNGNPAFISDPGGFFLNIGDQVAGDFIFGSQLGFLCDPLSLGINVRAALSANYFSSYSGQYGKARCTLSGVLGNIQNAKLFLNGNFNVTVNGQKQSGWGSWLAVSQLPQNNIYGSYQMAEDEMRARVSASVSVNGKVLDWGGGFQSMLDSSGLITMPGDLISAQLKKAFGGTQDALVAADEIGEMVSAVMGALMNQALTQGLSSLSTGRNAYTNTLRNGDPTAPFYNINTSPTGAGSTAGQGSSLRFNPAYDPSTNTIDPNSVNSGANQYANNAYTTQSGQTQAGLGNLFGPTQQTAKIDLTNEFTDQSYTDPNVTGTVTSDKAVDYATDTFASVGHGGPNPGWWLVRLSTPTYLDMVWIRAGTPGGVPSSMNSWGTGGGVREGPLLVLTDTSGQTYQTTLPDPTTNQQVDLTRTPVGCTWNSCLSSKKIREVKLMAKSLDWGFGLRDVTIYHHLNPVVDATNVPTTVASTTASVAPGFDPRGLSNNPPWITATYYPSYNDPQPLPDASTVIVAVKNSQSNSFVPPSSTAPLQYILPPGNYQIQYAVTDPDGFKSATTTRSISVLP